jgi:hypothetical protein
MAPATNANLSNLTNTSINFFFFECDQGGEATTTGFPFDAEEL